MRGTSGALHRRAALALVTVGLAMSSCSLLVDTSGLAGSDAADAADAATWDALANADSGTHAPDADGASTPDSGSEGGPRKNSCGALLFGTPLPLSNGDFELGCANGWNGYQATATEDTTFPSSGSIACRV